MEKEFVGYDMALELKELGFDEPCLMYYDYSCALVESGVYECKSPLYQQAFRWFREKHKLQAEILWRGDMGCFCYKTGKFTYGSHNFSKDDYKTYEEAELACLKKLIEILKTKK